MTVQDISGTFTATLGTPIHLAVAHEQIRVDLLSSGAKNRFNSIATVGKGDWLMGRQALHNLCATLGWELDAGMVSFPHRAVSLTHANGLAIAVAATAATGHAGVGIDYEADRHVHPRTATWFLNAGEMPQSTEDLLRLWTVKEAVYKACPCNRDLTLLDFQLDDPSTTSGEAGCPKKPALHFRYASLPFMDGIVSAAICHPWSISHEN